MAFDEAIAFTVRRDAAPPTLRIYGWNVPSVSIGYFQRTGDMDIGYCLENHIPVVRRPTGGRAILHGNDMTYSFSVKTTSGLFSRGLFDSYEKISAALCLALRKTGLSPELKLMREMKHPSPASVHPRNPFCFESISFGEVAINGKKIVGSAQKRWTDGLLQQGSMPFLIDRDGITKIFRLNLHETREPAICLNELSPDLNYNGLKEAVRISFEETFDHSLSVSSLSKEEISFAQELETQKYLSHEWTFRR
jgi:lipoate-protein ligase A